jgi:phosphinothricin acetyltransferase
MSAVIRPAGKGDAGQIAGIYNHYVTDTHITFETEKVAAVEMAKRIEATLALPLPWLVAEQAGQIAGYAFAARWKTRDAYRFVVESSIYLDPAMIGRGLGLRLYTALIDAIRGMSMHSVIGVIALPNEQSIGLHERLGFRKCAHFEQVGYKHDRWIDVGYWQLML